MTLLNRIGAVAVFTLSALAVAQSPMIEGAAGRGIAVAPDGRTGAFGFHAARVVVEGQERLVGNLRLEVRARRNAPPVVVHMRTPDLLEVEGRLARFAGPGKLVVMTPTGRRPVAGRVSAEVEDRRGPRRPGPGPDLIRVRFVPAAVDAEPFVFGGAVRQGDIRVQDAP
jgi:hypothetical protein